MYVTDEVHKYTARECGAIRQQSIELQLLHEE